MTPHYSYKSVSNLHCIVATACGGVLHLVSACSHTDYYTAQTLPSALTLTRHFAHRVQVANGQKMEDSHPVSAYGLPDPTVPVTMLLSAPGNAPPPSAPPMGSQEPPPPAYNTLKEGHKQLVPEGHRFCLGVGWDVTGGLGTDLDASCVCFDAYGEVVDAAFFNNTNACSGAVQHSGDNRTGEGDGDDEVVTIDPNMVPPQHCVSSECPR